MEAWFLELVKSYGLPAALLVFFIWRDWQREKSLGSVISKMYDRMSELEAEMRGILKDLVVKSNVLISENTRAIGEVLKAIEKCKGK
jgi:hypothetical protein